MRNGAAVLAATAALAAPAAALAGDPEPERPKAGCKAVMLEDRRGDADNPGLDLVGGFLSIEEQEVSINLVVAELDGKVDQRRSTSEYFRVEYKDDRAQTRFAEAILYNDGTRDGADWFDGPDGIIQIVLPGVTAHTATPITVWSHADYEGRHVNVTVPEPLPGHVNGSVGLHPFDQPVDHMETRRSTAMCPPKPAASAAAKQRPAQAGERVRIGTISIRGRSLRVSLRSRERVTNLRARLTRHGRVVARGRLDALEGRGVLVLTARRPFAAGAYVLTIPGIGERRLRIG